MSEMTQASGVPYRSLDLPPVRMHLERRDGYVLLRSADALQEFDCNIPRLVLAQARKNPHKTLYAQRRRMADGGLGDWEHLDFAEASRRSAAIGQWLLEQGARNRDTVLIITGNSIAHALVRLGCMSAGVSCCPVSANYALMGGGYERLRDVIDLVKPRFIFAESGKAAGAALQACDLSGRTVISCEPATLGLDATSLDAILDTVPGQAIERSIEHSDPEAHAVYMLTSGSTGRPKAVIQTQRMLSTNLHQAWQVLGKAAGWDDIMLDWLPWSHVSGAFNMLAAAVFGGTLYIDEGKPLPGLFGETVRNLREIPLPYYCNVPAGFALLADTLENDPALRRKFFSQLRMMLYGGAGLPQPVLDRLQHLAIGETGMRVFMTSGYGATETSSGCMGIYFDTSRTGIGLPLPGLEVKLVPIGERYELRLRGGNIMPGYLDNPQSTAAAFDEEGFYRTGDTARFHDDSDVCQGLCFAGRLAEEFKLGTGTWVSAGQVRSRLVEALAPAVSDVLLCGVGRDYLAVLGVGSVAGLRTISGDPGADAASLEHDQKVQSFLREALNCYNAAYPAGSTRIRRFAFMRQPPSATRYELSDKGTLNQNLAAEHRREEIDELYAPAPPPRVLVA